jgi:hypothetical protein
VLSTAEAKKAINTVEHIFEKAVIVRFEPPEKYTAKNY